MNGERRAEARRVCAPERWRCPPLAAEAYERLAARVGRCHLDLRLGIEEDREAWVLGQGRTFFHIENWYSIHGLIRHILRLCLLHERGRRNARRIEVRRNEIALPHLPASFEGFTLLHLSDLHLDIAPDMADALIDAVERAGAYDACVITGDFRVKTFGPYRAALEAMERVRARLLGEVYAVLGNHDSIRMVPGLEEMGVRVLLNEAVGLARGGDRLWLAGIDDPHYYRAENLEKATDAIPERAASILLSHSPEMYRHAVYARFGAMLSGHTHGGQICLPGGYPLILNAKSPRALGRGPWSYNGLQGYTSAGSGACIVDVRLNCPPEIALHTLRVPLRSISS
jgi:predicted MPP superfamily phosphohydrolase